MRILWALMDYNEPFCGGVERTFHNMVTMANGHENHIWPTSLSNRLILPSNAIRVSGPASNYDLAIIESNEKVTRHLDRIISKSKIVVIKMQHLVRRNINALVSKGNFVYLGYNWPDEITLNENRKNKFFVVSPFTDTDFWKCTGTPKVAGNFVIVGRVAKEKGVNEFLRAYNAHNIKERSNIKIVGGSIPPDERALLSKTLSQVNITYKWNQSFRPDNEVRSAYNDAEVTIVSSPKESFGHHIIESLLCGTPVMTAYKYWCSSLQWFGKYVTQCIDYNDMLDKIDKKAYINPLQFRNELAQKFGMKENRVAFNQLLETIAKMELK
jgi:glycosyltransferase involved in cell wall biosynthesis